MRTIVPALFLSVVALVPHVGAAQTSSGQTPSPTVTAAGAGWQVQRQPIFHAGHYYEAAGPDIFFDGKIMVPSGIYQGVPLYTDTTIEPFSVILLPIGRGLMRPYERRREGELAGTEGSHTPSFPVQLDRNEPDGSRGQEPASASGSGIAERSTAAEPGPARTASPVTASSRPSAAVTGRVAPASAGATSAGSIPTKNEGIWIEFEGRRWFSAGPAATRDAGRFVAVGTYRGFSVYRDTKAPRGRTIFVETAPGGPLAPYARR